MLVASRGQLKGAEKRVGAHTFEGGLVLATHLGGNNREQEREGVNCSWDETSV